MTNKNKRKNKSKKHQAFDKKMLKIDQIEWKEDEFYIKKLKRATVSYLQRATPSDKRKIYNETSTSWIDEELLESFKTNEFKMPKWDK
jgi:hypothetical protein